MADTWAFDVLTVAGALVLVSIAAVIMRSVMEK